MESATMAAEPIRVVCVDDLPDVTAVLQLIIGAEAKMRCVGCLASANDLVAEVRRTHADVLLLDATMPGRNAFQAMSELARECPRTRTIIFSGYDDPAFVDRAVQAGAWGCVSKDATPQTIVRALREVAAGRTFFPT